jgi:hypothetical protein
MSPTNEKFRYYCCTYPSLVTETTIEFFQPWPQEALSEVAIEKITKIYPEEVDFPLVEKIAN